MPAAGNHEDEVGNGPQGYLAYQTWFTLPENGRHSDYQGNWLLVQGRFGRCGVAQQRWTSATSRARPAAYRQAHIIDRPPTRTTTSAAYSNRPAEAWLARTLADLRPRS